MFVVILLSVLTIWMLVRLRDVNLGEYFKTKDGLGILKGIVIALAVVLALAVTSKALAGEFVYEASVFAGLDATKNESPLCERGSVDDKTTSNLGVKLGLFRSDDKKLATRLKYTHHSCAFGPDDNSYDGVGLEVEYKLWQRK